MDDEVVMLGTIEQIKPDSWFDRLAKKEIYQGIIYIFSSKTFRYMQDYDYARLGERMTNYPWRGRIQIDVPAVFYRKMVERYSSEGRIGAIPPKWHVLASAKPKE